MRARFKMLQAVLSLFASLLGFHAKAQCPNPSLHETEQDCPWAEVTRSLDGVTDFGQINATFDSKVPGILKQIKQDQKNPELFQLWGMSRNIDESNLSSGKKTAPVNLLQFFNSFWNVKYDSDYVFGHAGLTHTYGYLFSVMETPFGYKRARYVRNEIETGFGLPSGTFSGMPPRGTLFSNLTLFAGKIAFRDNKKSARLLKDVTSDLGDGAVPEIVNYDFSSLKIKRLVEVIKNDDFFLELRTDIVDFPKANPLGSNTALLVYSIEYRRSGEERSPARLITAFPVAGGFAAHLFDPSAFGDTVAISLKYNAALPDTIPAEKMVGKRFIFDESK